MNWTNKQLADVEKGCGNPVQDEFCGDWKNNSFYFCDICQAKRQTLLFCQAEREKELKEVIKRLREKFDKNSDSFKNSVTNEWEMAIGIDNINEILDDEITALLDNSEIKKKEDQL